MIPATIQPPPFHEPNVAPFAHPLQTGAHVLRDYCKAVIGWHGTMRFVGINVNEEWDSRIDELFIEPRISRLRVSSDQEPSNWSESVPLLEAVSKSPRLVLLGDPGSGKSTLVSWIAYQLARQPESPWKNMIGNLIPVPMILRDLPVTKEITWPSLWSAFFNAPLTMIPNRDQVQRELEESLHRGQVFLMLDGLDEIGDVHVRSALRAAVFEGMARYPSCRWLLTSRIVGYEEVSFDHGVSSVSSASSGISGSGGVPLLARTEEIKTADLAFVAPLNDEQISEFTNRWFSRRVSPPDRAIREAHELTGAISSNASTLRLARVPQLLTLMAMVFRVKAILPNGRAMLYEEIAAAYLKSIDEYRKLRVLGYPLEQKKRWLARVAFEMQSLRTQPNRGGATSDAGEILATGEQVQGWIAQAMQESGIAGDKRAACEFVDYVSRRSGLLLPRGADAEGRDWFSFSHLSFQEYFAACFLREQILSPRWAKQKTARGAQREDLAAYARNPTWRETLFFLFELIGNQVGWPEELLEVAFGVGCEGIFPASEQTESAAILLAQLSTDPHSGLDSNVRAAAKSACCCWEAERQSSMRFADQLNYQPEVLSVLFAGGADEQAIIWRELSGFVQQSKVSRLSLAGVELREWSPLSNLTSLESLWLDGTPISDLRVLVGLKNLSYLSLEYTPVDDLKPLVELREKLTTLSLFDTRMAEFGPLASLSGLEGLFVDNDRFADLAPIASLSQLTLLWIASRSARRISALAGLSKLGSLTLERMPVKDLVPLHGLSNLTILRLNDIPTLTDIEPLFELPKLAQIFLVDTGVSTFEIERLHSARRESRLPPVTVTLDGLA